MSEELLPVLVAPGLTLEQIAAIARCALANQIVLLALDTAPVDSGLHALELNNEQLAGPLVVLATPAGPSSVGQFPLRVRPLHSAQAGELDRFIATLSPAQGPVAPTAIAMPDAEIDSWLQDYLGGATPGDEAPNDSDRKRSANVGEKLRSFLSSSVLPTLNLISSSALPTIPGGDLAAAFIEASQEVDEVEEVLEFEEVLEVRPSLPPPRPPPLPAPAQRRVAPPDPLLGRTLGGKYLIEEVLGEGGMARVYRAQHIGLDRSVAVKVLHEPLAADPNNVRRFRREALAHSRIEHANVLRVLDFGQENDEVPYIVVDLLLGRDLRTLLEKHRVLPPDRIVALMSQVCSALSAAHKQGVVHRDIKPANIMIRPRKDEDGRSHEHVTVCDFGLAKAYGISPKGAWGDSSPVTAIGATVGTPDYLSPEQALGEECDPRTDIYSCGTVMYEMATGQVPFATTHLMGLLVAVATKAPRAPSEVNPAIDRGLEAVIVKALSKNRSLRQQSARDLRAELRALSIGPSGRSTQPR